MTARRTAWIVVATGAVLAACDGRGSQQSAVATQAKLIDYEIIERTEFQHYKVSFDLRVGLVDGRLPTGTELGAVSRYLHSKERKKYDRTFVSFFLPGMVPGSGSFASAHHKPTMKVEIYRFEIPDEYRHLLPDDP